MYDLLWISPLEALAVVTATSGMYLAMVMLVRILSQRVLSGMSSFDLIAVIGFGSIIGRAALGQVPVLGGGLVALVTLVVVQGLFGMLRHRGWVQHAVVNAPVLLMAGHRVIEEHMRRCHVLPGELQSRLRLVGISRYEQVAAVIFEPSGTISVLRRGEQIDPLLLSGVVGAALVPEDLLVDRPSPPSE